MAVSLLVLAGAFRAGTSGQLGLDHRGVALRLCRPFFAIGLGPVFWLLIAEIFPLAFAGGR